jgi:hypothetical protein
MAIRISDDDLVTFWHDGRAAHAIAKEIGVTVEVLSGQWKRLKNAGRLPLTKRPVTSGKTAAPSDMGGDGRPFDDGAMLDALWREHPEGPREDLYQPKTRPEPNASRSSDRSRAAAASPDRKRA